MRAQGPVGVSSWAGTKTTTDAKSSMRQSKHAAKLSAVAQLGAFKTNKHNGLNKKAAVWLPFNIKTPRGPDRPHELLAIGDDEVMPLKLAKADTPTGKGAPMQGVSMLANQLEKQLENQAQSAPVRGRYFVWMWPRYLGLSLRAPRHFTTCHSELKECPGQVQEEQSGLQHWQMVKGPHQRRR